MRYLILGLMLMGASMANDKWKLVWSDEFNYEGLPNPKNWGYEVGFIRNKEKQYYTKARKKNARVEKGMLIIEGHKETFKNPKYKEGGKSWKNQEFAQYTAASLITLNKASWKYGRIEVRAKLPKGKGVWPATWMLGTNRREKHWPKCGEIDIMEFVGHDPNRIHACVHFARNRKHASHGGKIKTKAPSDAFHNYAIEWNKDKIDFYFDKTKYHTAKLNNLNEDEDAFRKPHYLLINLALGGAWGKEIDDSIFPQKYLIDYVRVYQLK